MLTSNFISDYMVLFIGLILALGVIVTKFSSRLGIPSLIFFIGLGMALGTNGIGFINLTDVEYVQVIGIVALVIILFEGGIHTNWSTVRPVIGTAISLATVTVLLTSVILAFFAYWILDLTLFEAFLLGALVGSTDAAAVFATLKGKNIKARLGAAMEGESGANDPMAVFLTLAAIELITIENNDYLFMVGAFFWQMLFGVVLGLVFGKGASLLINRINIDISGMYPIFAISFAFITYSAAEFSQASGLLAVYVAALVIGNSELAYRYTISRFQEGLAWMAQIVMFVILGLLASPQDIFSWYVIWTGLLLSICLMFVARPVAVFISTIGLKYEVNERLFLSWAGLRGAVPIVLATFPIAVGVENSQLFFNVVFFIVITSVLIQGYSINWVAEKLKVTGAKKKFPHHSWELVNIGKANAKLVEFIVSEETDVAGKKVKDIKLPEETVFNALVREERLVDINEHTIVREDDSLYFLIPNEKIEELKKGLARKKRRDMNKS
ncbi:potassium/proton antiporter [Bacillus sp. FJAT-44742]|uniref:potassium/proton antiporter n=1 Tax=Bacillus sp. FJAT-44742 TaxID=2014005 RepID=UPI000C25019D|nr:potassium/proton antiporter [Bacillus sp. FJAT-44742]